MKVKYWIERLQKDFDPEESICMHLWTRPDTEEKAKEIGYNLTSIDCDRILEDMEHHIDSSMGVSWVTVGCFIDIYISENNLIKDPNFVEDDIAFHN